MARIKFDDGTMVEFNGTPTPQDVEEVANRIGLNKKSVSKPPVPATTDNPQFVGGNKSQNNAFKVAQATGMAKFGQGIAAAGRVLTGGVNRDIATQQAGDAKVQELITAARKQTDPVKKRRLLEMANKLGGSVSAEQIDPNLQLTNKEVLGSAGNVALNLATVGGLSNAGRLGNVATGINKVASLGMEGGRVAKTANLAVKGAALGYASDVAGKANQNKDNILTPGWGTGIGASLPVVTATFGWGLRKILGTTTGAGSQVLDRALRNPDAVQQAVNKYAKDDATKTTLVDQAKDAINKYLNKRNETYGGAIDQLTLDSPVRKGDILNKFEDFLGKFKGKIVNGQIEFNSSTLTATDKTDIAKFWDEFSSWQDFTPQGVDNLRQMIGNHIDDFNATRNSRASVVLGKLKDYVTSELTNKSQGYDKILKNYGDSTTLARNILSELNLKGNAKPSTQINSIMRLFKKDPQVVEDLYKIMGKQKADSLLNEISGAVLSNWLPSGTINRVLSGGGAIAGGGAVAAGIASIPTALAGAATVSPRVVGKATRLTGKAINSGTGSVIRRGLTRTAGLQGSR